MIDLLKYIFLGFIQGVTEALPISSSGHLLIFKNLLNVKVDFDSLAIITNLGSLIAVIVIFRKDIVKLVNGFFKYLFTKNNEFKNEFKYCLLIVLGCIPAGLVGLIVKKLNILNFIDNNVKIVGISLLVTALLLFLIRNFDGKKEDKNMSSKDAIKVGLFQIIGIFPGISRSGSTIVGGMFSGLKRDVAFKFSFLIYIPMSIAATLVEVKDLFEVNISSTLWLYYIAATITSFIFTLLVVKWFRKIVREGKLIWFVYYCLLAGLLVLIFL